MYRSNKTTAAFERELKRNPPGLDSGNCPFCQLDDRKVYFEGQHCRVVENSYPYEFWDKHPVESHLLLLPNRHVLSLADLTDEEKTEVINVMAEYEDKDYSVYWRSENNKTRTIAHQHTHLFKLKPEEPNLFLYLRRPYFLWTIWRKKQP